MKYFLLLGLVILSYTGAQSQQLNNHFSYEKGKISAQIVENWEIDSLTLYEKVVLDGFSSKIPFYHFLNERKSESSYAILLHGLGGKKDYWVNPSMPYLQFTENLTAIKDSLLNLGFSLVIIDAKYHGERSYELNFRNPALLPPGFSKSQSDARLFYELYNSTIKEVHKPTLLCR